MDIIALENLGLSNTEAKVYLALLELGSITANKIAEKSGIHRRTIYDALETLIEKGLVGFVIEANKKYYQAESPERFLELLEKRKEELQKIMPELLAKKELSKKLQEVTVFRGKKGLKNAIELMLKSKMPLYVFGSSGKFKEVVGDAYYGQWIKKLQGNKIRMYILLSKKLKKEKFPQNIKVKYIKEKYILPSSTSIWEDKILIQVFSEQPIGILIRSEEISNSYLKYFNMIWKIAE